MTGEAGLGAGFVAVEGTGPGAAWEGPGDWNAGKESQLRGSAGKWVYGHWPEASRDSAHEGFECAGLVPAQTRSQTLLKMRQCQMSIIEM